MILKKNACLLVLVLCAGMFSACSVVVQDVSFDGDAVDFSFASSIGQGKKDALNALGLAESDLLKSNMQDRYYLHETVTLRGIAFTKFLEFGDWEDKQLHGILYAGGYECIVPRANETLLPLMQDLSALMTERFGDKSTYPGMSSSLENLHQISDLRVNTSFFDTWDVPGDLPPEGEASVDVHDVEVRVEGLDAYVRVRVKYQIKNPRLQLNPRG